MKEYIRPTIELVMLRPEESIANPCSGCLPKTSKKKKNNGFGNGDQDPPGKSGKHNGAENDEGNKGRGHNKR